MPLEIKIQYDTMRYNALQFALGVSGKSLENELTIHLDKLYERQVPANVRAFVEHSTSASEPKTSPKKPKPTQEV